MLRTVKDGIRATAEFAAEADAGRLIALEP
jgi:hypothetical protein